MKRVIETIVRVMTRLYGPDKMICPERTHRKCTDKNGEWDLYLLMDRDRVACKYCMGMERFSLAQIAATPRTGFLVNATSKLLRALRIR